MPLPSKPPFHLDWVPSDDPTKVVDPGTGKKNNGWLPGERPGSQFMNWLFYFTDQWNKYFEQVTDTLEGQYDVVIGTDPMATHATLQAANDDVLVGNNQRVLVKVGQTLNATINLSKPGWRITFAPGVTLSKGTATIGLQLNANSIEILHARFAGFSTSGDIAIQSLATKKYCKVLFSNFANCDTEVDDSAVTVVTLGNITE